MKTLFVKHDLAAIYSYVIPLAVIFCFYAWQCTHSGLTSWDWIVNHDGGAYGQLATSFCEGHLYLDVVPDPKLAQVADPYLPINRLHGTAILWDYAYFKAQHDVPRYYLYFGPAPVLFYIPFVLCGWMPSSLLVTFLIACLNVVLFALLQRDLVKRYLPDVPLHIQCLLILDYGFCNFLPNDVSAGRVYETAIVAGTTFTLAFFVFLLRSFHSLGNRCFFDLFIAGVFGGLALSSKITDVFLCFIMATAWLIIQIQLFRSKEQINRIPFVLLSGISAFMPFMFFIVMLCVYNEARFGNPRESGTRFLLNQGDCLHGFFSLNNVPEAILDYYIAPINVVPAAPFIHPSYEGHLVPIDYSLFSFLFLRPSDREIEDYTGIIFCFPICIQAMFWYTYVSQITNISTRVILLSWGGIVCLWWIIITGVYCAFFFLGIRYETEMQMPLLLLTFLSILTSHHVNKTFSISRRLILFGLSAYSCIVSVCLAITQSQIYSHFHYY